MNQEEFDKLPASIKMTYLAAREKASSEYMQRILLEAELKTMETLNRLLAIITSLADRNERLSNALRVLVLSPEIRAFLRNNDPKALEQARQALDKEAS
jgi:hypothetical protein